MTTPRDIPLAADFPPADLGRWRQIVDKAIKGADFEKRLVARTADGIRIEPLFTARPASRPNVGRPRGMERSAWDIRQLHVGHDPAAVNVAVLEDLAGGATSVTLQIEGPGQYGLGSRGPDVARALEGVLLDVCPVAFAAGENTHDAAGSLMALWVAKGISPDAQAGAFNYDPLGYLAQHGGLYNSVPVSLKNAADLVGVTLGLPGVTALAASGPVWHAAGASEAQELAAVLATIVAYLRAAEAAGITPAQALPKIGVTLAVDADQMLGLAKLRAARRLIQCVADSCAAPFARVGIVAETSRTMMTLRDPWVNMLRTTMACATAAMGGADTITVLPFTQALGQPDSFARRMARNTSIVLMEESALGRVADPAAGSFAIETLTDDLAKSAWSQFQRIEAAGGLAAVLSNGSLQAEIAATAAARARTVSTGKSALTGTSAFPRLGDEGLTIVPWPSPGSTGLLAGASIKPLAEFRPSAPFEVLRDAADAHAAQSGHPPTVLLACLGPLSSHGARATWIGNFLAAGGINSVQSEPLMRSQDAGAAFSKSGARVACICGTDESYAEIGEATASLLKSAGATKLYLAGRPREHEAQLKAAGVDNLIFAGCDMITTLASVQAALGVRGTSA